MTPTQQKIAEQLGLLGFLMKAPLPAEIDEFGWLSKSAQEDIDKEILTYAGQLIQGFEMPENPGHGSDPNNKWRTVSTLQKAIRHGNVPMAQFAASAAMDMDKQYATKRLGVIAVEDCLMGNPVPTLITLAMLGNAGWRKSVDERRLLVWLATQLAEGAKDRTAVNLLVWAGIEPTVPKKVWAKADPAELIETALEPSYNMGQRMCAAWLLAGTKRYGGGGMPEDHDGHPTILRRLMVKNGMSRFTLYLAAKTQQRLGDGMWISMLLIDEMLKTSEMWTQFDEWVPEQVMVGPLLGAGYDKHTREGNTAIRKFFRECKAMRKYMDATDPAQHSAVQGTGVFLGEGGTLNTRFVYGSQCDEVTQRVRTPARFEPYMGADLAETYLDEIRENLPQLNECREKVLWAKLRDA